MCFEGQTKGRLHLMRYEGQMNRELCLMRYK